MSQALTELFYDFDPNAWELPNAGSFITQSGQYKFTVTGVELKPTASNAQHFMLVITCRITEGELAGQTFVDRLNLVHSNPDTAKIAHRKLAAYCAALGITTAFRDAKVLINGAVAQANVVAEQVQHHADANKKVWNNEVKTLFFADGSDLTSGKFGGGQAQPANGGFTPQATQPQVAQPQVAQPQATYQPQVAQPQVAQVAQPQVAAPVAQVAPPAAQQQFAPPAAAAPQGFAPPAGAVQPAFAPPPQ